MSARERLIAALAGSPEVRRGEAERLVADLIVETIRDNADDIIVDNDRMLWASKPGKHWAADLLRRKADRIEKDTHPGESTRAAATRSAQRLAAFLGGARLGRTGGNQ
jgi:hypothetical protein